MEMSQANPTKIIHLDQIEGFACCCRSEDFKVNSLAKIGM